MNDDLQRYAETLMGGSLESGDWYSVAEELFTTCKMMAELIEPNQLLALNAELAKDFFGKRAHS